MANNFIYRKRFVVVFLVAILYILSPQSGASMQRGLKEVAYS
jgi:hypothetical protein